MLGIVEEKFLQLHAEKEWLCRAHGVSNFNDVRNIYGHYVVGIQM